VHTAMEVVFAENHQFSSRLCTDGCDEQLSRSSDAMLCGISVHQSQRSLSADVGTVEKRDEYVAADTPESCSASLTSPHSGTLQHNLAVVSGDFVPCVLPAESCTVGGSDDSCIKEDSESACTSNCAQSAVTAEVDISAARSSTEIAEPQCIAQPKSLCSTKKSVCFPVDTESLADQPADDDGSCVTQQESKRMSLLLRLFESKLFDMAIALPYLFNSKEPGVLAYLGQ